MYFAEGLQPSLFHSEQGTPEEMFKHRYSSYFHRTLEHFPEILNQRREARSRPLQQPP